MLILKKIRQFYEVDLLFHQNLEKTNLLAILKLILNCMEKKLWEREIKGSVKTICSTKLLKSAKIQIGS